MDDTRSLSVRSLVAALGAAFSLCVAGAAPAEPPKPATLPGTLDVMTINLEHHDDPAEMKAMAADLKKLPKIPEFILCQEVYFERHGSKANPEENTAAVLANYLGYYCKGTKRTSDREGIALISKYPFEHYDSINLKHQTLTILLGFRRVSIMGEFLVPGVGKVRVADTHLTNWEFEGHVRNKQIAETMKWVEDRQKAAPATVTLFGGDFNAKHGWDEMKQVLTSAVKGGLAYADNNGTAPTQGWHGRPFKRIDFIFVAAPTNLLKFLGEKLMWKEGLKKADGEFFYPSDHLGVVHTYALGQAPSVPTASVRE